VLFADRPYVLLVDSLVRNGRIGLKAESMGGAILILRLGCGLQGTILVIRASAKAEHSIKQHLTGVNSLIDVEN
jgi:hypothetical protein